MDKIDDFLVGIVLVNYNGAQETIECIKSINKSIKINYKIVVVDNFSTDDSVLKLKEFSKHNSFKLLCSEKNDGFSSGNNIAIKYLLRNKNITHIMLLNNDTIISQNTIYELIKILNNAKYDVSTGKIYYYTNKELIWYAGGEFNEKKFKAVHYRI